MGVEFEEESNDPNIYLSRNIIGAPAHPKMLRLVIKAGIAKTEKGAGYFLIGVMITSIILGVFIFLYFVVGFSPIRFWNTFLGNETKTVSPVIENLKKQGADRVRQTQSQ